MPSPSLKCLVLLLLVCMGAKGVQAQALVLCLEADGGIELELATGARCADRVDTTRGEAPSGTFDNCPEETEHCGDCADFAVPQTHLKTGRVETEIVNARLLISNFFLPSAPASKAVAAHARPLSPEPSVCAPRSTVASLRATVLLI